jgi:cell fate regulator YaaT (PSP1 superfamily)
MPKVVDIALRGAVRARALENGVSGLRPGDRAVVRTARGMELAEVRSLPREEAEGALRGESNTIARRATEDDLRRAEDMTVRERDALAVAATKVAEHGLPMKLIAAEATLDGGKIVLHFSAEGRVDFRSLVRDLARTLRARIELHQVGVRDEARLRGGLGPCGRELCCSRFLQDFEPVGIKMAKEQDLSLNPQKISGVCGRLMCCLNYEYEHYRDAKRCLPKMGSIIKTPQGSGKITEISVLRDRVTVLLEEGGTITLPLATCAVHRPGCPHLSPGGSALTEEDEDADGDALPEEPR